MTMVSSTPSEINLNIKWIKLPNKKTECLKGLKKNEATILCCLQDIHFRFKDIQSEIMVLYKPCE